MTNAFKREDIEMTDDLYGAMLTDAPVRYRMVIWGVFAFFAAIITWQVWHPWTALPAVKERSSPLPKSSLFKVSTAAFFRLCTCKKASW